MHFPSRKIKTQTLFTLFLFLFGSANFGFAQTDNRNEKAEAILNRAVEALGGEKYRQVKSVVGRGRFSILRDGAVVSYQTFVDVIVFPDKERTEFRQDGIKTVQTNAGGSGWIFDGGVNVIKDQSKEQLEGFKRGIRTSLDNLLRGYWRGENAVLSYAGQRQAGVGRRNDVVKLTYKDDFAVEFEFSPVDGLPAKAIYKRLNADKEEVTEEDRYAQFVDVQGIKAPFIVDRFTGGAHSSRINYQSIEFNKNVPDSIFAKPSNPKDLRKDLRF